MVDRKTAMRTLKIYGESWTRQDSDKILTIFTTDAKYHERVLQKPFVGHVQIKKYWQSKVVEEQSKIKFRLLNLYIDGNIAIAEWDASFYSNIEKSRIHIVEVAILEFRGDKIKSLREYWHSETIENM